MNKKTRAIVHKERDEHHVKEFQTILNDFCALCELNSVIHYVLYQ